MSLTTNLKQLAWARRVADYADRLGVQDAPSKPRRTCDHLGAALADAILQAGLNYHTVVRTRVERILARFPEASTMSGIAPIVERGEVRDFLMWQHQTKVMRFVSLTGLLSGASIQTTTDLSQWLCRDDARRDLLGVHGIGPKTYDYLCCLVGIDCIAIDRHIRTFAQEAGVSVADYDGLKTVVSYAADLLGMTRRDFDAWIWTTVSSRTLNTPQLSLI